MAGNPAAASVSGENDGVGSALGIFIILPHQKYAFELFRNRFQAIGLSKIEN
jgi:hypothetical protein